MFIVLYIYVPYYCTEYDLLLTINIINCIRHNYIFLYYNINYKKISNFLYQDYVAHRQT